MWFIPDNASKIQFRKIGRLRILKNLGEIDLDDEFLNDFEPENKDAKDSDATSIDSDKGEPLEEIVDQD